MTFALAVLSDQHIDREVAPDSWELAKRAFATVVKARVDHVVLAGDTFDGSTAFANDHLTVKKHLAKLGLWHRDRLSIAIGNHDFFHVSERRKLQEGWKVFFHDAQGYYEAFWSWIRDLVDPADRVHENDIFPNRKRLGPISLVCADTTARTTWTSTVGYWRKEDDRALRKALAGEGGARLLCCHHPPYSGPEESLLRQLARSVMRKEIHFGFVRPDYRRLRRFVDDMKVKAVLCGHLHDPGESPYEWTMGKATQVFLMGRTGGMHYVRPSFGLLTVGARSSLSWKIVPI